MLKGLFHIHTKYSFDSILSPKSVVEYAIKNGYSLVAITDHDTIRGSVEARDYAAYHHYELEVIIGAEYSTEKGDIIGLLLKEEVRGQFAEDIVCNIKAQKGIVVLPHPYKGHHLDEELITNCDIIEVYNSRANELQNRKAGELAITHKKPTLVGSDAHFYRELHLATVNFTNTSGKLEDILLQSERFFEAAPSPAYFIMVSQLIKGWKTRDIQIPTRMILSIFRKMLSFNLRR